MESVFCWFSLHAANAHFIIFGLLLLTGACLPISEEVMLIMSGILASTVIPSHTVHLFLAVFLGCFSADCLAYWVGRFLGNKLYNFRITKALLSPKKQGKLRVFYSRYGLLTLLLGRFIPFGVRNGIFMTAGIGKMHFGRFALTDLIGCFVFSLTLFFVSYYCGQNYDTLVQWIHKGNTIIFTLFLLSVAIIAFVWYKKRTKPQVETVT